MIKTLQCFPLSLTYTWSLEPYTICFFMNSLTTLRQVQSLSHVRLFATPWTAARQASLSITNSQSLSRLMSLSQWCRPAISSSAVPFSSCLQSFPASGSFPTSQLFTSGGQRIGASVSASVSPMNIQFDFLDTGPLAIPGTYQALCSLSTFALYSAVSGFFFLQGATSFMWSLLSDPTLGVVLSDLLSETFPEHSKI